MEEILKSLGQMMRFANRISNTHPELVNNVVLSQIENAKKIISENSDIKESEILKQSYSYKLPGSTSLKNCPFNYCDKNPKCENKCRYNLD